MKARKLVSILLALCLIAALTGCGGSSKGTMEYAAGAMNYAADMAVAETMAAAEAPAAAMEEGSLSMESTGLDQTAPENRKWIVTMNISVETEDLDTMTEALQQQISQLGGYVEHQNLRNGSRYADRRYRHASLTIRIPAQQADTFAQNVGALANVVHSSKSLEDITLSYVATESRVNALQTEEARLLELMAQAENMADLLEIEGRLTDVRYELELHTSQLRLYDNQVNYATIYLDIEEVTEYTPVAEQTLWQKISTGFMRSLRGVGDGAVELMVWVIANSPYLAVLAAAGFLAFQLGKKVKFKKKVPSLPRKEKKASQEDSTT